MQLAVRFLSTVGVGRPGQGGPRKHNMGGSGSQTPSGPQTGLFCGKAFSHREEPPRSGEPFTPTLMRFLGVFVSSVECTHAYT